MLDSGAYWEPEPFQLEFFEDIFSGRDEAWLVVAEGNGKTTMMAGLALYHGDHMQEASVPMAASSRDQTGILFGQAAGLIRRTPGLGGKQRGRFRVYEGYRRIDCRRTNGKIQVFAADDKTGDGVIPTLALVDELHRHKDLRLYRTWRGKLNKRGGQIVAISTAGEPGSEFEETRDRLRKHAAQVEQRGPFIRAESAEAVIHDWAVRDRADINNLEVVAEANPLRSINVALLEGKHPSASPTMTPEHWMRFVGNIATRVEGQAVLPEDWDAIAEPGLKPNKAAKKYGWLDLGWKIDTTAMGMLVWESRERRVVTGVNVIQPPVDEAEVVRGLLDLQDEYGPHPVAYDPNAGGQQLVQLLEKCEHPEQVRRGASKIKFIEHSQDNAPMAEASRRLDEAIRSKWLVHDDHPELRVHVLNAVRKGLGGEKWKYDRPPDAKGERRRKYPIDALQGLLFGHNVAVGEMDHGQPFMILGAPR